MGSDFHFFPELHEVYSCANNLHDSASFHIENWIDYRKHRFPLTSFRFGENSSQASKIIFVSGLNGQDKLAIHLVLAYLKNIIRISSRDNSFAKRFKQFQLIFYPLANPTGMFTQRKTNENGVDLTRNAPIDAGRLALPLFSGQRISSRLPWYRGSKRSSMEVETSTLCQFISEESESSELTLVLDVRSSLGSSDNILFPYSCNSNVIPDAHHILALKKILDCYIPSNQFQFEPAHKRSIIHGDLWDFLYSRHHSQSNKGLFIPLRLEIGNIPWLRRSPKQALQLVGIASPVEQAALKAIQQPYTHLFDFLLQAVSSEQHRWAKLSKGENYHLKRKARQKWYPERKLPADIFRPYFDF